jgi:translation initiation factor 5A
MSTKQKQIRDLREGSYVIIQDTPCEIDSYSTAKPGKHGSAKARVEATGVFDDKKRNISQPVDASVRIPIINRKNGQILNISNNELQIMDLDTYDTFKMRIKDKDISEFSKDDNIEFLEYEGKRKLV